MQKDGPPAGGRQSADMCNTATATVCQKTDARMRELYAYEASDVPPCSGGGATTLWAISCYADNFQGVVLAKS